MDRMTDTCKNITFANFAQPSAPSKYQGVTNHSGGSYSTMQEVHVLHISTMYGSCMFHMLGSLRFTH